jgi:methionyl-tRNA formyltransferase
MRLIFMGTPDFAVPSLEELNRESGLEIRGIVTRPERPRGRGQRIQPSPVQKKALELGLEVLQVKDINQPEFIKQIRDLTVEAIVVVAFGQKLGQELLDLTRYGCLNLHASLLPDYRGASPINQVIIDGRKKSGITTMYMDAGWDTGDIIYQEEVEIKWSDTAGTLHDKLAVRGAKLLVKTLRDVEKGIAPRIKQDHKQATYADKIDRETGKIDWNKDAEEIFNLVRGVNPWPGACTTHQGKTLKIWQVIPLRNSDDQLQPGEVTSSSEDEGLVVKAGQGSVEIKVLQLAGRKKMSVKDFLRGYTINVGDKFI